MFILQTEGLGRFYSRNLTVHAYLNDLRLCCTGSDLIEGVI